MKFIADAMLGKLAKRMRLLGYDVLYDPALGDNDILRLALEQERTILTRDTGLAGRPLARDRILIESDTIEDQLRQVFQEARPTDAAPLTRCSVCNGGLLPLDRNDARDRVPDHVLKTVTIFFACDGCGRIYWKGSHVKRMTEREKNERAGPGT